ncbi:hypothetical protein [Streptomyces solincola]|nr:hypothetical protein [Streptomyces solincola]
MRRSARRARYNVTPGLRRDDLLAVRRPAEAAVWWSAEDTV